MLPIPATNISSDMTIRIFYFQMAPYARYSLNHSAMTITRAQIFMRNLKMMGEIVRHYRFQSLENQRKPKPLTAAPLANSRADK